MPASYWSKQYFLFLVIISNKNQRMEKVWIITGCSTGFGRELAKLTLKLGYKVGVASRKTEDVKDIIAAYPATALALKLDVTKPEEIRSAVEQVKQKFGRIDVLV